MLKFDDEDECNPDDNGRDPDSSEDESDYEDYNDDEVATREDPEDNQN